MKTTTSITLLGASLFLLITIGCNRTQNRTTKVTIAGEATARVEPDTAVLVLSVVTQSPQAITAQQENARKSDAVAAAVKSTAGTSAEIKTSDYSLEPQYDYRDNRLPKIIGYDARNSVIVTMTDLKNVGAVIDASSRAGANSIERVSFELRQTSPARGQALAEATQQAMNKAKSIAGALGGRVLRVVEESEGSAIEGEPTAGLSNRVSTQETYAASRVTPISYGPLTIRSQVRLIVEIES